MIPIITPETKAAMDRTADAIMAEHRATQRRLDRRADLMNIAVVLVEAAIGAACIWSALE
jgi:hypothetical protein